MSVTEIPISCWICGNTRRDQIKNDDIRDKIGVTLIQEKLVQHRLPQFGHIQQRPPEAPICSDILSHPENTKKMKRSIKTGIGGSNKKGFEG
jgi:hypothetical protein